MTTPPGSESTLPARPFLARWAGLIRAAFRVLRTEGLGQVVRKTRHYFFPANSAPAVAGTSFPFFGPDKYCHDAPSNQTAVNIFQGSWLSVFPDDWGMQTGGIWRFFDSTVDDRLQWANQTMPGGVKGKRVLELGPLEACHTWWLEKVGEVEEVVAVEGNSLNYLKCLIVKEIAGLKTARFLYGDFIPYLEQCARRFDFVCASGVLYHSAQPVKLIGLIAKVTDRVLIHTHYYADTIIGADPMLRRHFRPQFPRADEYGGFKAKVFYRSYNIEKGGNVFAGGNEDHSCWMTQEDIFNAFRHFGLQKITVAADAPSNPAGPAMVFLAERS